VGKTLEFRHAAAGGAVVLTLTAEWKRYERIETGYSTGATAFLLRRRGATTPGDVTVSFYIWGAQLEQGAFPTSYIPTTSPAVTRAADVASMTGTNFSDWYRHESFAVCCSVNLTVIPGVPNGGLSPYICAFSDESTGNRWRGNY
jgi:hypothetical protein